MSQRINRLANLGENHGNSDRVYDSIFNRLAKLMENQI